MGRMQHLYRYLSWIGLRPLDEFPSIFIHLIVEYVIEMIVFNQIWTKDNIKYSWGIGWGLLEVWGLGKDD